LLVDSHKDNWKKLPRDWSNKVTHQLSDKTEIAFDHVKAAGVQLPRSDSKFVCFMRTFASRARGKA
jgi:hypothetical protein